MDNSSTSSSIGNPVTFYHRRGKRIFDLILASLGLLLISPLLLLLALLVRIKLGSPVIFRQQRPGLGGEPFMLLKFRTMNETKDSEGRLLPAAERLTTFGRWLRSTSLDELPALLNVIKGQMSLVGPRPLLMDYLPLYSKEEARRHQVPAGITGWAQVKGRNSLTWPEKFALDAWYVDHCDLALDLRILAITFGKVVHRDGISPKNEEIMPQFTGGSAPGAAQSKGRD